MSTRLHVLHEEQGTPGAERATWLVTMADPTTGGAATAVISLAWGVRLVLDPDVFEVGGTVYRPIESAAPAMVWGVALVWAASLWASGMWRGDAPARRWGMAMGGIAWALAGAAQLHADAFSPTPLAMALLMGWVLLREDPI